MQYNEEKDKITEKNTEKVPRLEDGQVGIRATLKKMGFSDNSIGYNDATGMVTLEGREFMKPGYLDNEAGRSYAYEGDIQKNLTNFYKNTGNPVVRVSDAFANYAGEYGVSADALGYGNGSVTIGGKPIDILYIDDAGKAWARQNTIAAAAGDYVQSIGLQSPVRLAEEYASRYLSPAINLANDIKNRSSFSYNPDEDPVFQAYKNKYLTEGARASANSMATYAGLTGGYANSAAATAAAQAEQYYATRIADRIPELAQQAYNRYSDQYQMDINLLQSMVGIYDKAYNNAVSANAAQQENVNTGIATNYARDKAAYDASVDKKAQEWKEHFNLQEYDKTEREKYWYEILNADTIDKNSYVKTGLALDNAQKEMYMGYYERLLRAELEGSELDNTLKLMEMGGLI